MPPPLSGDRDGGHNRWGGRLAKDRKEKESKFPIPAVSGEEKSRRRGPEEAEAASARDPAATGKLQGSRRRRRGLRRKRTPSRLAGPTSPPRRTRTERGRKAARGRGAGSLGGQDGAKGRGDSHASPDGWAWKSTPPRVPELKRGVKRESVYVCGGEGKREIRARRRPASHSARTRTRRVGPVAGRLGSGGRARVGYVFSCGCAGLSLVSGGRQRSGPAAVFGVRRAWHRGCPPARGPRRGHTQSFRCGPGAPRVTHSGREGKSLRQVQTWGSRGEQRAPPPAEDPTREPVPAPLPRRRPDARHRKLSRAAWAGGLLPPSADPGAKGPRGRRSRLLAAPLHLTYANSPARGASGPPAPGAGPQPPPAPQPGPTGRAPGGGPGECTWSLEVGSSFFLSFVFSSFLIFFSFFFFFLCWLLFKVAETRQEAAWEKVEQKWKNTNSPAANGLAVQTKVFSAFPRTRPLPPARAPRAHTYTQTHARAHALAGEDGPQRGRQPPHNK